MKKRCLLWYSKVLAALLALLGVVSCGLFHKPQPCMYGGPYYDDEDSVAEDTLVVNGDEAREIGNEEIVEPLNNQADEKVEN